MSDDAMTQRAQARLGKVLRGKWRLDKLLGVGGMASVYAATHRNGKRGAVKLLHVELNADDEARSRFLREGYVANKVDHPGVVSVLDDDSAEDGAVFLVMELLEGETVEARVESRPGQRLSIEEVVTITDQLLDVLAAAHAKGIVHRDLKPENLFLTTRGQLKVLDFGIARLRERTGATKVTQTGSLMGTPAFMPPEQALGNWEVVDARSDVFAVGATMFYLLTGRPVHIADTLNKLLLAAMTKPAPLISSVIPDLPPKLASVVDQALKFEQNERFSDVLAMRRQLHECALPPGPVASAASAQGTTVAANPVDPPAAAPTLAAPEAPAAPQVEPPPIVPPSAPVRAPVVAAVTASLEPPSAHLPPGALQTASPVANDLVRARQARTTAFAIVGTCAVLLVGAVAVGVLRGRGASTDVAAAPDGTDAASIAPAPTPSVVETAAPTVSPAGTTTASATATVAATASPTAEPTAPTAKVPTKPGPGPTKKNDPFSKW